MSQAELVARYSVQTLLGLFLNTAMPLNFTQDVVFLPGNVTFARTVRVWEGFCAWEGICVCFP